jgi:hypothetical protein
LGRAKRDTIADRLVLGCIVGARHIT